METALRGLPPGHPARGASQGRRRRPARHRLLGAVVVVRLHLHRARGDGPVRRRHRAQAGDGGSGLTPGRLDPIVLPALAGLATLLAPRLTNAVQPPSLEEDEQVAARRRLTFLLSPLDLAVFAHFAPAALALYWATSSLIGAAQQWGVNRLLLA